MKLVLLFVFSITTLFSSLNVFASESTISIITSNKEFPGFRQNYVAEIPTAGLEFELVQEICKILEKSCSWNSMEPGFNVGPVPTILEKLQDGTFDLAIAFMRGTKERMYYAKASAPYLQTRLSIFGYAGNLAGATTNKSGAPLIEGKKVVYAVVGAYKITVKDYLYPNDPNSYEIIEADDDDTAIELVKNGTAHAAVTSELKTNFSENLDLFAHFDAPADEQWGPRMYVSNSNVQLMRDINKAMKTIIDNGIYDQILVKYGSTGREPCFQGEDDDATINIVENYDKCL